MNTAGSAAVSMTDIKANLAARPKAALVEMLMDQVGRDELLRERLMPEVVRRGGTAVDVGPLYLAIDQAVGSIAHYDDWHGAATLSSALDEIGERLRFLLREGHATDVVDLAAYGLAEAKGALEFVDDSDGYLGTAAEELASLHLAASRKAHPDQVALAGWLFGQHSNDDYGSFVESVSRYKPVLGKSGIAEYRRLAEAEWAKVPVRRAGQEHQTYEQSRTTRIMEDLAQAVGDTDGLIEVMSRDLSYSYAYLRIAEVLRKAGREGEALAWAEAGICELPAHTDARLREFLADAYHDLGRHADAMSLAWAGFVEQPSLKDYQGLKAHAERAASWPAWRDKALARMGVAVAPAKKRSSTQRDHSELVRVFLWEGDPEAAWQQAAAGRCDESLWRELADRCETTHPDEALTIFQRHVELLLAEKNDHAYAEAVQLLQRARALLHRLHRSQEFADYLATVRALHKPKRNFMKRLDASTW